MHGFISPEGIFIIVPKLWSEEDNSSILAESICFDILKCNQSEKEIATYLNIQSNETMYKDYLIEYFGYLYVQFFSLNQQIKSTICAPKDFKRVRPLQLKKLRDLSILYGSSKAKQYYLESR